MPFFFFFFPDPGEGSDFPAAGSSSSPRGSSTCVVSSMPSTSTPRAIIASLSSASFTPDASATRTASRKRLRRRLPHPSLALRRGRLRRRRHRRRLPSPRALLHAERRDLLAHALQLCAFAGERALRRLRPRLRSRRLEPQLSLARGFPKLGRRGYRDPAAGAAPRGVHRRGLGARVRGPPRPGCSVSPPGS